MAGTGPRDRVASSGSLTFALDNSEANSAGLVGYYSLGHPNARPGFRLGIGVRLKLGYDGVLYYKWRGVIDAVRPIPGEAKERRVSVSCVDWMDEAAKAKLRGLAVQTNKRSDQVFSTIVAA